MKSKIRYYKTALITTAALTVASIFIYVFLERSDAPRTTAEYVEFCDDDSCHAAGLPYQDRTLPVEARLEDLMGRMTITEKIGQMALIEKNSIKDPEDIARYGLGALMSGGGAKPEDNTPAGWLQLVKSLQGYGEKTRLRIPVLYGVDAIHGHSNIPGATNFPHSIGLGATRDAELVKEVAAATAREVAATGIYWIYSPNLDVAGDTRWGRTYETFGSDQKLAGQLGQAYINGIHSIGQEGAVMIATAKHFVGNGASVWGSSINKNFYLDQGGTYINEEQLRQNHLEPFKQAIEAGVKTVMVGLNKWNGEKVVFNEYLINGVLKHELGFTGFVTSDWYGVFEDEKDRYQALVKAVNAGVDMVMLPYEYQFFSESMHRALVNGDIRVARIDDAVRRILKVKFETGLFDRTFASPDNLDIIGAEAHRELAREAVRKSLVLLKNKKAVPVSKHAARILVAGSAADNIGKQSGGWTVEWQGIDGNWVPGTTVLKGIRDLASPDTKIEYNLHGDFIGHEELADIGIAVVGEHPYAEGWGDNADPRIPPADIAAINKLKKACKKIVVVIISGRPLNIAEYADDWDAIIAAWLPGSEGQGVADVLFGDYPFTGSLPVDWAL